MNIDRAMDGHVSCTNSATNLPAVSLVLPAFNEELVIRQAVREAVTSLRDLQVPYEVIVVDDGSTDGTAREAAAEAALHADVRVISLVQNSGYTAALQSGFRAARHALVAFTDADCQFDLHDLGRLLPLAREFDLVCGYRIDRKDVWRRRFLSGGFNLMARTLVGTTVRDCDCALKVLPRDWMNALPLEGGGFFFNAELLAHARLQGLRVTEVGVTHRPRAAGVSKVSLGLVLPVLAALLRFWWTRVLFPATEVHSGQHTTQPASSWGRTVLGTLALAAIGAALLLPWSSFPLLAPDEARYAEIAREMLDSRDFVVPTRMGQPYLEKPPLLYWLTAGSFRLFGVSVISARLVPMLTAMLTVFSVFWLGTPIVGRRAAWLGAVLLLACAGFLLSGRFLYMDTLLTLLTTIVFLSGYLASRGSTLRLSYWIVAAIACGLGILTKGPVALALCLPPLIVSRWLTIGKSESQCRLGWKEWAIFGATAAMISFPWFAMVAQRQQAFAGDFLWTHHISRFVGGLSHREPIWFFLPVLLVCTLPCSILYPALVGFLTSRDSAIRSVRSQGLGFLLLAAAWVFGVFSLSSCKLPPYILPAVPLLSLATGTALYTIMLRKPATRFLAYIYEASPRDLTAILAGLCFVVGGFDCWLLDDPLAGRVLGWSGAALLGAVLLTTQIAVRPRSGMVRWSAALAYALVVMGYGVGSYHTAWANRMSVAQPIAALCGKLSEPPAAIVGYSISLVEDAIAFHLPGQHMKGFESHQRDAAISALQGASGSSTVLITEAADLSQITEKLPTKLKLSEVGRSRHYVVLLCSPNGSAAHKGRVALHH